MIRLLPNGFIIAGKAKDVFRMINQMCKDEAINECLNTRFFTKDDLLPLEMN